MKSSAILAIAVLSSGSLAAVHMNIARNPSPGLKMSRRMLAKRSGTDFTASLQNEVNSIVDANYIISVQVGTPGQDINLAIDTGSSDVWVLNTTVSICSSAGSDSGFGKRSSSSDCTTFDSGSSSTFKVIDADAFDIKYQDGSGAQGDYFTDVLSFGNSETLKAQTMGIAYESTLRPGLLGIGYDTNEASEGDAENPFTYSSVIDSMVTQGLIGHKAYSLYLDDLDASTGSLLFGAIDSDKYQGDLVTLPIIAEDAGDGSSVYAEFSVHFTGLGTSQSSTAKSQAISGDFDVPAVLDSGTTLSYVPTSVLESLLSSVKGDVDNNTGFAFVDCALRDSTPGFTFDFTFGTSQTAVIKVPAAEMIYDAEIFTGGDPIDVSISNPCALGFMAQDSEPYVLGDNFLRSAYVVYDLKNNIIGLGQTNFDSTSSNIIDIPSGATTIPSAKGVATSAVLEPTGTAGGSTSATGSSGSQQTSGNSLPTDSSSNGQPSGTSSSSGSSSTKGSRAATTQPLDLSGLAIMGMSLVFAALGGGLLLA